MSVPRQDPKVLWALRPDEFNHWRGTNELPVLFAFLRTKFPGFDDWMAQNGLDADVLCRFVPTGALFSGSGKRCFVEEAAADEKHVFFWPCASRDARIRWARDRGEQIPEFREIEPYFGWAKRVLKRDRYFKEDDRNQTRTDSFIFGAWGTEGGVSRAYLFRSFELLKLGAVTVGPHPQIGLGRRNLDLADLDSLVIEGRPSNYATSIRYSTGRQLVVRNALLHHVTLHACHLEGLLVENSELQSVSLENCSAMGFGTRGPRIVGSTLRGLEFQGTNFVPDFDDSDLINVEYRPSRGVNSQAAADNFRKLRAAYQGCARRREAAKMYFLERVFERKALSDPYLDHRPEFPPMRFAGHIRDAYQNWYSQRQPAGVMWRAALHVLWFKIRVWFTPKYCWRALSYKRQYVISLLDSALWGYGEKPGRVFLFAAISIAAFTAAYFVGHEHLANFPKSGNAFDCLFNAAYFSIVTFTTLGYGDILPGDNTMKAICAAEALTGAFTMGMVVAGFANRGRY
jgi:hypothetical protein